jgi:hypothetical protein
VIEVPNTQAEDQIVCNLKCFGSYFETKTTGGSKKVIVYETRLCDQVVEDFDVTATKLMLDNFISVLFNSVSRVP